MKKSIVFFLLFFFLICILGCQPTPAAEPVPYQGNDPVDNAPATEVFEKIDAPHRMEASFTDEATGLTVAFDCEVKTPEVSAYSILAAEAVQLSQEDFAAAIEALCPGRPLLQAPVRTQAEWGAYITRCKQNLGESDPGYIQYLTEQMMNAPQAYEPVPFHLEDIGAGEAFEAYFPGEEGAYGVLSGTMGGNSFYYSRDQEVGCIGEDDLEPGLDDAMLGDYQGDFPISAQEALPYARAALAARRCPMPGRPLRPWGRRTQSRPMWAKCAPTPMAGYTQRAGNSYSPTGPTACPAYMPLKRSPSAATGFPCLPYVLPGGRS